MPTICYVIIIATLQLRALVMAMQIGDLIRMKREEHGLTQEQLAELIGKSAGYIGQLERGLSMASIPTLKRLVNVLSLDANQIFYDEKQDQYQFSELEICSLNWTSLYRNLFRTVSVQLSTKSTHDQVEGEK